MCFQTVCSQMNQSCVTKERQNAFSGECSKRPNHSQTEQSEGLMMEVLNQEEEEEDLVSICMNYSKSTQITNKHTVKFCIKEHVILL